MKVMGYIRADVVVAGSASTFLVALVPEFQRTYQVQRARLPIRPGTTDTHRDRPGEAACPRTPTADTRRSSPSARDVQVRKACQL